jgi:hypothetical protein
MARSRSKKKKASAVGFVLPRSEVATKATQTLGALPGLWEPGKVHLADEFGLTDDQMRDFIEQGYPIHEVEVEAKNEEELEKALQTARVDEITVTEVEDGEEGEQQPEVAIEGTPTAEEHVTPPNDDDEGKAD